MPEVTQVAGQAGGGKQAGADEAARGGRQLALALLAPLAGGRQRGRCRVLRAAHLRAVAAALQCAAQRRRHPRDKRLAACAPARLLSALSRAPQPDRAVALKQRTVSAAGKLRRQAHADEGHLGGQAHAGAGHVGLRRQQPPHAR